MPSDGTATRFLNRGRVELGTDPVRCAIRPVTLGRKNHLFAGSDDGERRWTIVASLTPPYRLNDVLPRMINGDPVNRLDELVLEAR
ncbi:transposase [Bradyrhizobium sp. SZCCHNS3002]|uniref:IS66 family transposase n=1 Tax=unclassified Bradyrhizobium TaxID=2631580 RepID=UPI0039657C8B